MKLRLSEVERGARTVFKTVTRNFLVNFEAEKSSLSIPTKSRDAKFN
jgi:hypothetical protein